MDSGFLNYSDPNQRGPFQSTGRGQGVSLEFKYQESTQEEGQYHVMISPTNRQKKKKKKK